jgi:hypothetical protein
MRLAIYSYGNMRNLNTKGDSIMITPMWNRWDWGLEPFSELRLMERRSAKNQVMHKTKHEVA